MVSRQSSVPVRALTTLALALGLLVVAIPTASVAACTPTAVPRTPFPTLTAQQRDDATRVDIQGAFSGAAVVMRARVVAAAPLNQNNQMLERAEMVPLATWKGPIAASFVVYNVRGNDSSSSFTCVPPFYLKPGGEYIVYAFARQDGAYDLGTRTRAVADADDDLRVLGPGTSVGAAGGTTATPVATNGGTTLPKTGAARDTGMRVWMLGILAAGSLALAGGFVVRRHRTRR